MTTRSSLPHIQRPKGKRPAHASRRERQIVRILALLRMLGQGRTPTVHELAAEFHTRRETIYRDLRVLEDAGYPVAGDEQGKLSRPRLLSSPIPDLRFSGPELEALLVAAAQAQVAIPAARALSTAVLKLKSLAKSSPGSVPAGADELLETWSCGAKDLRPHEGTIALLIEAILRKRRCRVEYRTPTRSESKRYEFDPYRLLFVGGGLYVVGRVPTHTGTATLSIDRLLSLSLSDTEFEVDLTFDPQNCRRNAFGVAWNDTMEVVLRFRSDQAPYVRERIWHPSQKLTDLPDGAVELAFRAGGPFEIRRWILGWGDAVEVISPQELRKEMEQVLSSAKSLYAS